MTNRRQSIFQSTKAVAQTTANIVEETAGLVVDQIKVTRTLNATEDATDIKQAKVQAVMDIANITAEAYAQLVVIDTMNIPDAIKQQLKDNLLAAIA